MLLISARRAQCAMLALSAPTLRPRAILASKCYVRRTRVALLRRL